MAVFTDTTTALAALLSASIASVTYALEQTRTVLARHGTAPIDTLEAFYGIEPDAAPTVGTRQRSGLFPNSGGKPYGTANCSDTVTVALAASGDVKSALARRRQLFGGYDG